MDSIEKRIATALKARHYTLATAESCTGGSVAGLVTSIAGSSDYFKGGVVAYANEVKLDVLHVNPETLKQYGAVSEQTVREMALGVINLLHVDCAVATSGIAGPSGGTEGKPVGTIWMAAVVNDKIMTFEQTGDCGRSLNVTHAVNNVLELLLGLLK
jgi:nicotinamide-nucleotide amidase